MSYRAILAIAFSAILVGSGFAIAQIGGSGISGSQSGGSSGLSGMTAGQVPIAATATTVTSSFALGTGVKTFLTTPSSANLLAAISDETGTGAAVFGTSPSLTTPTIAGGALSGTFSGNFTASGVPILSGLSSGTCANNLALDSGNHIVTGSCPSGGATGYTNASDVVLGVGAGPGTGTVTGSVIIGAGAAPSAPAVGYDVAIGYHAMHNYANFNTAGPPGGNVAIGANALANPTDVFGNVAIGINAMTAYVGGASSNDQENVAIGYNPLASLTTGHVNVAIGTYALTNETTGGFNTAIGFHALYAQSGASDNIAIGGYAGKVVSTGHDLIAIGQEALFSDTTDSSHVAIGYHALHSMVSAIDGLASVAVGGTALQADTGGANVAVGANAGNVMGAAWENTVIGASSGISITTGKDNTCVGYASCSTVLTTGQHNIVIGDQIDVANATGSSQLNIGGAITGTMGTLLTVNSPVAHKAQVATVYDYNTPVTTNTITAATNSVGGVVNPAGTIAALTYKLPASPVDGQIYKVGFTQVVTVVTWQDSGGTAGNVVGGPSAGSVGLSVGFIFRGADSKWYPI